MEQRYDELCVSDANDPERNDDDVLVSIRAAGFEFCRFIICEN